MSRLSNLDAKLRISMRTEIRAIQKRVGITAVYVTHDQSEAMAISDRVIIMNKGVIQQMGTPKEIYYHPVSEFVADFIGEANFLEGVATSVPRRQTSSEGLRSGLHVDNLGNLKAGDEVKLVFVRNRFTWMMAKALLAKSKSRLSWDPISSTTFGWARVSSRSPNTIRGQEDLRDRR
jgi:ABC-type Fe3+/spermidine/putrescine transport system ATPase subunit